MTNTSKVQKIAITAFIAVVMAFLFLNLFTVQAYAAGLLDETIDTAHEFSRYPIDNYQLDFYVDSSWDWLPWNWLDGIGKTAQYAIYLFTNFLWTLNLYISNAVGYLIQQAYDLDFISSAASEIGKNIQLIAGVSASGLDSMGLFPGMMAIVTLLVGVYCTYVGLVKRETTKAFHAALNFVVVFVVSVGLIAYAPSAISGVNEFSSDISNGIVDVSAKILAPDTAGENTGVSAIRDCLFGIQVKQPWLIMQFGDSDVENIGEERVNSLLGTSPDENRGKDREEVVKSELEDYDNGNLTVTEVTSRFGLSVFFLIFNLIVSAFAIMLTGSMLLSQILFIISAMFLPVSLLISMIPAFSGTSRRAVISLFNTIMLRVGTTLLTTFVLVLSSLAYTIANGKPFVVVVLLQVIVFAGVYMERDKLLGMIGLRDEDTGHVGRAMTNRPRRTISRAVRKALPFAAGVGVGKRSAQRRAVQSTQRTASTTVNRETVPPEKKNLGQRVGETAGKIADTPSRVRDKAAETVQKVKDAPTNAEYAVRSNVESARESVRETMQKRREARAAQMESRRTTTASHREQLSQRKRERNEGNTEKPERKALVLHQRSAQLSPNSRKPNRKSRLHRRIDLGRNGLNRHPDSGKIVRRSRISRRLWLQTTSRTVRQNARLYKISRKHGVHRPCRKDWTKKPLVRSSNSGKLEKSRANSGAPKAEVSENDEKGGNGRCYGHRTADCFTSVDVSDYRFG
ncbi:YtxH domain-containing protein [Butyricicoccus sp. AF22-28AC]|nr:Got1/Sft2-like family vesicle transport protein [Butyricicoccus sp. AF22-28AC]RHQ84008.1 YtxH domain-containing protein [Butyricicoccus sp. AF22-28AC]